MVQKLLHYEVLEQLGEGARSVIYAVRDPQSGKTFALKHVKRLEQKDLRFIEQMETEFQISRQFSHPVLRKSYDLKFSKSLLLKIQEAYLLMEYFDGKALDVRLPTNMVDILDTFIKAAQGLKAMHAMGYAHCDIKPNNILRDNQGEVKIIDFGQSCKIGTIKERIQGTPDYIAPEQVSRQPISVRTDVFNLGATMYWALTGTHIPTLYKVQKEGENSFLLDARFQSPRDLNPNIPQALSNMIMECISTSVKRRPADMEHLLYGLELAKHIFQRQTNPTAPVVLDELDDFDDSSIDSHT